MSVRLIVEVYVPILVLAGTLTHHPTGRAPIPMVIDPRPVAAAVS